MRQWTPKPSYCSPYPVWQQATWKRPRANYHYSSMHGEHLLNSLKMYFMNVYGSWPVMTSQRRSANPSVTSRITQCIALPGRFLFSRPWDQHTNKLWDLFSFLQALLDEFLKTKCAIYKKGWLRKWFLNGIPAKGKVIIILCIDSGLFSGFGHVLHTDQISAASMHIGCFEMIHRVWRKSAVSYY